jgi:heme-degrading monooxygenase HmoA
MSVREIAQIHAAPGSADGLAAALKTAKQILLSADGCRAVEMLGGIEDPDAWMVIVTWDSVEKHREFQGSPQFGPFVTALMAHADSPPVAAHFSVL